MIKFLKVCTTHYTVTTIKMNIATPRLKTEKHWQQYRWTRQQ